MKNDFIENDVLFYNPTIKEKIKVIRTKKSDGKKRGYDIASKEYNECFNRLEKMWSETINIVASEKSACYEELENVKERFKALSLYKSNLEELVKKMTDGVSQKYHVPYDLVEQKVNSGTLLVEDNEESLFRIAKSNCDLLLPDTTKKNESTNRNAQKEKKSSKKYDFRQFLRVNYCPLIIDLLYILRLSILHEAAKEGYRENKKNLDKKLDNMIKEWIEKYSNNIVGYEKVNNAILAYTKEITKIEIQIAELRILLSF